MMAHSVKCLIGLAPEDLCPCAKYFLDRTQILATHFIVFLL